MPPFSLSDAELEQLMVLATPLPPQNRSRFFEAVSAEVQARGADCVGPGTLHRTPATVAIPVRAAATPP